MAEEEKIKKPSRKVRLAREFNSQFIQTFSTLLTSAFGLVAAFAWNDLVKAAIDRYISSGQGMISRLIYALLVTILAVLVSYQLGKIAALYKIEEEDSKDKEED
ncbi:MAG: DUF5654 family protein [Candidatus Berkelbacteria bacterium]|nr:DUF5654 family protein [Candidatus Berkelbacteria bacterium]